ncbi:hypothetical protein GCM10011511_00740 [Puia dinghuensis]|uniref:Secretion system C-terminal sorting domain-containing protein n=1 Tax=Puia dinghuensis TaxID=1792502 RepID=A0A8J2U6E0_9BACT|nr:hypothetical protein GCM10011511_00740 [Puia dinghuensis]
MTDLTDSKPYTLNQSGQAAGFPSSNAFTNSTDATAGWQENKNVTNGNPSWVSVTFTGGSQVVRGYSISAMDYSGIGDQIAPTNWKFQAFNGFTWVTLDTRTGITFSAGQTRIFTTANNTAYSKYRLYITKTFSSTTTMGVAQIQLFQSVCLTGTVFQDGGNRDKVYNAATDAPLSSVTVSIVNETLGNVVASTTSNAAGVYTFTSAQVPSAGNFSVIVTPPAGKNFVTETTNLLNSTITLPSPEEESSSGAVLFDYYQNQQATFQAATNRMLFPGGNLDFGLMNATPAAALACGGTGSVGTNLITVANNGTFGTASGTWTTLHPHQRAFTVATSSLYSSIPAANTTYTFSNAQANPGSNNSGVLFNDGYYAVTSYLGTLSDLTDQPYMSSLVNTYIGTGWRKTFGATTGDMYDQFLAVNGPASTVTPFFQQSGIALTGGTGYSLSFFGKAANSYAQVVALGNISDAPVVATVTDNSGTVIASSSITLYAPSAYTQDRPETPWQFGNMSFVAPATGGPFTVSLTASSSALAGNDFYIDNITLTPCSFAVVLPLSITAFTATPDEAGNVRLAWNIANPETGTTVVEYSNNGSHFEPIATLSVQTGVNGYQYLHMHPDQQYNYYRLKMVNADGNIFYSDVQLVTFNGNTGNIVLYPNPAANVVYISGTVDISSIVVTNAAGQTILSKQTNHESNLSLNTSTWKQGCYFIKLIGRESTFLQRLVIAR